MLFEFLFVVKDSCCEPLFDVFPVLFDWVEFWAVWWQAYHFDVVLVDVCQHFFGEMPSCIVNDDAKFGMAFVQSFKKGETLFSVDFLAELCCDCLIP